MNDKKNGVDRLNNVIASADMSVHDALTMLDDSGKGILLICDPDRCVLGVLTDGDVRRYILHNDSLKGPVSNLMNKQFITVHESERHTVRNLMRKHKIGHVLVVDTHGRVVDLITTLDFVKPESRTYDYPVVIMAGGKGNRLLPLTKIIPKPLIPVGDQTMIEMIMKNFQDNGFSRFFIIVNYKKGLIKSYFQENDLLQNVTFVEENDYLGTAGGLGLQKGVLDKTFIVSNCDIVAKADYGLVLDWHKEHKADLTILGVRKNIDVPYGVIKINSDNYVSCVDEKPRYSFVIMSGIYIMEPAVLDFLPANRFCEMDKLIEQVIESGKKVSCYPIENGWFDVGQFDEYKHLLRHLGSF